MSADFLCWVPALALLPGSPSFFVRTDQLDSPPRFRPAHAIVEFVHALEERYPDAESTEETAWADGPMLNDANGGFIHFSVRWDYYKRVTPFVLSTAHRLRLDCFDPQSSRFYPVQGPAVSVPDNNPPISNSAGAIEKAKKICRLKEPAQPGKWQVNPGKGPKGQIEWHVWYGQTSAEPVCGFNGAFVESDGTTSCAVSVCRVK